MTTETALDARAAGGAATRIAPSPADRAAKRERVHAILDARGADALVLRSHGALAWYLDGARTHVSFAGDPVLAVVVRRDGDEVRAFANEADRLVAEELDPADADALVRVPWHGPLLPADLAALVGSRVGSGAGAGAGAAGARVLDEADVAVDLRRARASLLPAETDRYRALGRESAEVLTDAVLAAAPADAERDVAARVAAGLVARGIDPLVVLVAGASRLGHRHPLPTAEPIGRRAMLVACGRRHGLIANVTRWVRFGPAAPGEADASARILEVEADFLAATRPGRALDDVFAAGIAGYARHGFDPDEWRRHHQGGAAGYVGRDPRAVPGVDDPVHVGQAFAWNPTAPGAKVEDTVLLGASESGASEPGASEAGASRFEVLTRDPRWPTVRVGGLDRPLELERDA
ncbi:M24 family metallopeptidase [Agromyces sp. MMS24-K17]|uniref:M24 family metallopeptidase n=1 Tax=Agromyces sp. MMS24-K17 TaxID=3372850 RepID=UPI0037552E6F